MLVVQEVHRVKGTAVEEFEFTTQQFWKEAAPLGVTPAWFFEVSHGTGPSYCVITGLRLDGWAAWEAYARAVAYGELSAVTEELDATRYDSESSVLDVLSEVPPASGNAPAPGSGCSVSPVRCRGRGGAVSPGSSCGAVSAARPTPSRC